MEELALEEPNDFKDAIRMTHSQFNELLTHVQPYIQRCDTKLRMAVPAKVKLQVTLSYLANGSSFKTLAREYRLPHSTISLILPEVLVAIRNALSSYLQVK